MSRPRDRRADETRGRRAERIAVLYLILKGYRIRGRRVRRAPIEIDILAERGGTLALVEVKYRRTVDEAIRALTPAALARLDAAAHRLAAREVAAGRATKVRVDLVALAPWSWPRHMKGLVS
ncbi:YraN family protein [Thermaurantiacus sp.]